MIPTIKTIIELPSIDKVKKYSQSLAMLDAIIMPEWEYRYFSFNAHWDTNEMMASMRNGGGDEYFIVFKNNDAIGKVLYSEHTINNDEIKTILSKIPSKLSYFTLEKAFNIMNFSFYFWNLNNSDWNVIPNQETLYYLGFLTGDIDIYYNWATEYYEIEIDKQAIEYIFNYKTLNLDIIKILNSNVDLIELKKDILEIGYPSLISF